MMNLLSIFCLYLSFVLATSICTERKARKEGFLREPCVPGFYEGSCLIISNQKLSLDKAMEKCQYEYGGRLATAPSNDAFKFWTRTIHFNTKIDFNNLFWIGYDKNGFKHEELNGTLSWYHDLNVWNRVFNRNYFFSTPEWEIGADKNTLEDGECPNNGVVFNPKSQKFDIKNANEQFYSLCETPRWTKLQCETGWYVIQQLRMCVKVHGENVDFYKAHAACNQESSFIATAQNELELKYLRRVITPLNLNGHGFWSGLKAESKTVYSMDGTKPLFIPKDIPEGVKRCSSFSNGPFRYNGEEGVDGLTMPCKPGPGQKMSELPFMCQRFADQSLSNIL